MPSTVPGFVKPSNFRLSDKFSYVSLMVATIALLVRNDSGDELGSSMVTWAIFRR